MATRFRLFTLGGLAALAFMLFSPYFMRSVDDPEIGKEITVAVQEGTSYIPTKFRKYFGSKWNDPPLRAWPEECTEEESAKAKSYIITSISDNHFDELHAWVGLTQQFILDKNWEIIVLDLGISKKHVKEIKSWEKVDLVPYDWRWLGFDQGTSIHTILEKIMGYTNSVWKPPVVWYAAQRMLRESDGCGYIFSVDPSVRTYKEFWSPPVIPALAYKYGFLGARDPSGSGASIFYSGGLPTAHEVTGIISRSGERYAEAPVVMGGFTMWRPSNHEARLNMLYPWVACARNITCIAPPGAVGFPGHPPKDNIPPSCAVSARDLCHRGDQGLLTMLTYEYFHKKPRYPKDPFDYGVVCNNTIFSLGWTKGWPTTHDGYGYIVHRGSDEDKEGAKIVKK